MQSSRSVYIFMKPKRRCTSVVSAVTLLIGVAKKTWLIKSFSRSRRLTTARAVITHYAPPLEGFWTNPLVVVGEAPSLSQTGYKAYSYSPWAVITLSCIRDANWCLLRFVTYERITPTGAYDRLIENQKKER